MNKKLLYDVVGEYNKARGPEAIADLVEIGNNNVLIKFTGPFCTSCCIEDYFEDFIIVAENKKLGLRVKDIKHVDSGSYIVKFEKSK